MRTEADSADTLDMEALRAGEDLALNRLMQRYRDKLFHYLARLLQDDSEALDLAQESFVRVYLHRAQFNPKKRFSTWLFAIATNLARDRMRWLARHPNISLEGASSSSESSLASVLPETRPAPDEQMIREERIKEIKRWLLTLPEDLRTPLILAEYEDLSVAEIGEVLEYKPKAIENRLYRARKLLREKLGHLMNKAPEPSAEKPEPSPQSSAP